MSPITEILREAAGLVGINANPLGFFSLVIVLLFAATILLFQRGSDRTRLFAFAALVVVLSGITVGVFVKPPPLTPDKAQEERLAAPPAQQIQPQAAARADDGQPPAATLPTVTAWIYYEVGTDGRPTRDGQLEVLPSGVPMPDFKKMKKGTLLRTISPVNLRSTPPDRDEDLNQKPVATLKTASCIMTAADADPTQAIAVRYARSGGWLYVSTKACPAT